MKISFVYAAALFSFLFLISCEEDPTSIGNDLLPPEDLVEFVEIDSYQLDLPQESNYFDDDIFWGQGEQVLIGKNGNLKGTTGMRFFIPITVETGKLIDSNKINILSAKVYMKPKYIFGDSTASFSFSVHNINEIWSVDSFTVADLHSLQYDQEDLAQNLTVTDTLITFELNPTMILNWMKAEIDSTLELTKGLLFVPDGSCGKILGFQAFSPSNQSIQTIMEIGYEKPGVFVDTITATLTADMHVVEGELTETRTDRIVLQGGIAARGQLKFDLGIIPPNSVINNAELEIHYDSLNSVIGEGLYSTDSVAVYIMEDYNNKLALDSLGFFYLTKENDVFRGQITRFVQRWMYDVDNNGLQNNGLMLRVAGEKETVDKRIFFGSQIEDPALKPRLKIIYSRKQ